MITIEDTYSKRWPRTLVEAFPNTTEAAASIEGPDPHKRAGRLGNAMCWAASVVLLSWLAWAVLRS